jgi:hypothetical protein
MTHDELRARIKLTLDGKPYRSFVEDATDYAHAAIRMLADLDAVTSNLTAVQARGTELITDRRTLVALLEKIAAADPTERLALIDDALATARQMR